MVGAIIILIIQMKKQSHRGVKSLAQSHTESRWSSWDSVAGILAPEFNSCWLFSQSLNIGARGSDDKARGVSEDEAKMRRTMHFKGRTSYGI